MRHEMGQPQKEGTKLTRRGGRVGATARGGYE